MNRLQLWQLKRFCKTYELDKQLIDEGLSYSENMGYLESLAGSDVQELAEEYGRAYEDEEESLGYHEKFGVDFSKYETSFAEVRGMMYKVVVRYTFKVQRVRHHKKPMYSRKKTEVIKGRTDLCFRCVFLNCKARLKLDVTRRVIKILGTRQGVSSALMRLDSYHIRHKVVKIKVLSKDKQYVQGLGWIRKP